MLSNMIWQKQHVPWKHLVKAIPGNQTVGMLLHNLPYPIESLFWVCGVVWYFWIQKKIVMSNSSNTIKVVHGYDNCATKMTSNAANQVLCYQLSYKLTYPCLDNIHRCRDEDVGVGVTALFQSWSCQARLVVDYPNTNYSQQIPRRKN